MNLESHLDRLKTEINLTQRNNEDNLQTINLEKREKDLMAKDKTATSKHL